MTGLEAIREAFDKLSPHFGCGSHSCAFVRPAGQGTNGLCRCHRQAGFSGRTAFLYRAVRDALAAAPQPAEESELRKAAQAALDRWSAPSWRVMGESIEAVFGRLRDVLEEGQTMGRTLLEIHEDWHGRECDDREHCMWCQDVRAALASPPPASGVREAREKLFAAIERMDEGGEVTTKNVNGFNCLRDMYHTDYMFGVRNAMEELRAALALESSATPEGALCYCDRGHDPECPVHDAEESA